MILEPNNSCSTHLAICRKLPQELVVVEEEGGTGLAMAGPLHVGEVLVAEEAPLVVVEEVVVEVLVVVGPLSHGVGAVMCWAAEEGEEAEEEQERKGEQE
jgi:hypothetical protein